MATFTITPTPGHNVTYGFKDDMFDFESNPPKPALYDAAPDLAERLARSSDGSAHDVAAVARLWDPSCSVHQRIGRPDLLVVQSCTELPDVAKEHIRLASQAAVNIQYEIADPWVKVGTTTIDGSRAAVAELIGCKAGGIAAVVGRTRLEPRDIGGRMLRVDSWDLGDAMCILRFDIVRRLSECCEYCDRDHLTPDQRERASECAACSASIAAKMEQRPDVKAIAEKHGLRYREQACPECGPHGNAGRVLGADLWYPCTLCAGGYPGDVHEVHRECEGRDERGMSCAARDGGPEEVEAQRARDQGAAAARAARGLRGARELAALRSSLTEATVDNLRRYEALMADFKAGITIPNTPHMYMAFEPGDYKPGEFSFAASDLRMPTHSRTDTQYRFVGPIVTDGKIVGHGGAIVTLRGGKVVCDEDAQRTSPHAAPERPVG